MPSRNTLKIDVADSHYHVYARGSNKQTIFVDQTDFDHFISLFERYLSVRQRVSKSGVGYPSYHESVRLQAYCLMGNHFHLLLYQRGAGDMSSFMRSLMTSYSKYYNARHRRTGPVFESRYKASRVDADSYLDHISRYIHLNPRYWRRYPYSSYQLYTQKKEKPEWLDTQQILALFDSTKAYIQFCADYEAEKQMLEEIKYDLADQ